MSLFLGWARDREASQAVDQIKDTDICLQLLTNVPLVTEYLEQYLEGQSTAAENRDIGKPVTGGFLYSAGARRGYSLLGR